MESVRKRGGRIVPFDPMRIEDAILKAARAVGNGTGRRWAANLSSKVVTELGERVNGSSCPNVEEIQDVVEEVLIGSGHPAVAKSYILYREQRAQIRETRQLLLDGAKLMDDYLERLDWRVRENSNMNYSLQGLNFHVASSISARYWLHKIYPPEAQEAHVSGDFHIHDLSVLAAYCCGWDLEDLLLQGFGGVPAKISCKPPRHFRTALGQLVNFFYTLQGETAGAQAVSSFDTLLAPFIRFDNLTYPDVKQAMQGFVFNMNVPTRVGFQTPFSNLTMDLVPSSLFRDKPVIIGGQPQGATYGEFQPEMDMINRAFAEIMLEGDAQGRVFTFPIPTYNITPEFDWENPILEPVWQMTAKYGIPYFCLEAGTPVLRDDYTVTPIESLCPGDKLLNEYGESVKVTAVFPQRVQEAIHIELENGQEIVATPSHRFPTQNGITMAQELSLADKLQRVLFPAIQLELSQLQLGIGECRAWFYLFRLTPDLKAEECDASQVRTGQVIYLQPKGIFNQDPPLEFLHERNDHDTNSQQIRFPPAVTPQFCRLLGYLVGDGYYAKRNYSISFVNADKDLLSDFITCLNDLFKVRYSISQAGQSAVARQVSVNSVVLRSLLHQLGVSYVTAHQKVVPFIVFRCSASGIAGFIRALFDTDGAVDKQGRLISFFSTSHTLVRQVQVLLCRLGIMSRRKAAANGSQLTITGSNIDRFAERIGFTSSRKSQRLAERATRRIKNSLGDPLLEHDCQLDQLVNAGQLPRHYRYLVRKPKYQGRFYRVPASGLTDLFTGHDAPLADVVASRQEKRLENVSIVRLGRMSGSYRVVDISVDSPAHLFTLGNGILSHNSNFINSDMNPDDARSMCPLSGRTKVVVRSKQNGIRVADIIHIVNNMTVKGTEYKVLTPSGTWVKAKPVKVKATDVYRVWSSNGAFVDMGENHLQPTMANGTLRACELAVDMWLPFTKTGFEGEMGEDDSYHYYRITKIELLADVRVDNLYCFEVDSPEHLFVLANGLVTHNCRLRLDNRELRRRGGGLFGANPLTGSIGVVTLNMPRIGYLAADESDYFSRLERLMEIAKTSLGIKHKVLNRLTRDGLYPYSKHYLGNVQQRFGDYWANHFSTIGLTGMNESCLNFLGVTIAHPEGKAFAIRVLEFMRQKLECFQKETGQLYNLEATPAESAGFRMAKADKARFPDIRTAGTEETPFYTNSTHLPVDFTDDLFAALEHQDDLQTLYTGGTVLHSFLGERIEDWRQARLLVKRIAENFRLPYSTLTPTFSICPVHGYISGEHKYCPYDHTEEELERFGQVVKRC